MTIELLHLYLSPGHDFRGRHGLGREEHAVSDCNEIEIVAGSGIIGDRYFNHKPDFKGQITFFDAEVWEQVIQKFNLPNLDPSKFRRNVIAKAMPLNELIGQRFQIGDLEFSGSEEAAPCYWMDEACAPGVEQFLRGKGGLRCRIRQGGLLEKGNHELRILGPIT